MGAPAVSKRAAERRSREREARVARIRAAAERVFAEHGYEHATMELVAEAAELGKATLYYYFKNKHELFTDIVAEASRTLGREAHVALSSAGDDPMAAAEALYRFSLTYLEQRPDLAALLLPLMSGGQAHLEALLGPEVAAEVGAAHAPLYRVLGRVCEGLPGGENFVDLMSSLLIGLATRIRSGGAAAAHQEVDLFFEIVRRACATRGD